MKTWEIERMFKEDIRDKKKTGTGAFHMRGKGVKHGFSGALRTPSYYMKPKERKKLDGEVKVFNMFTTILEWPEFSSKDKEVQKELLTKWREVYTNDQIMEQLQVGRKSKFNSQSFADLVNDLGVPRKYRVGKKSDKPQAKKVDKPKQKEIAAISPQIEQPKEKEAEKEIQTEVVKAMLITKGLHLEYNGEYDVEALNRLFTKLQLLVDGEPNKYRISLSLSEIEPNEP
jgi:hypothetical protein